MKKQMVLLGAVLMLLAAGCNQTANTTKQGEPVVQTKNDCSQEKIAVQKRIGLLNDKNKQQFPEDTNLASIKEIFYSPKIQQCVYVRQLNTSLSSGKKTVNLTFFKASSSNVTDDQSITLVVYNPDNLSTYQAKIDQFNKTVQEYR